MLAILAMLAMLAMTTREARAETLIRWDFERIPPPQALGLSTLVVPAGQAATIRTALEQGYRVYVEIEAASAATFKPITGTAGVIVKGTLPAAQIERLAPQGTPVRVADDRGKWPHIRTNWVTRNKDVLQVTNRSSQPWLENNEALVRIAMDRTPAPTSPVLLTYAWQPVTVSDLDRGPRLENYLVAIAEAGSFGADLLLPLHQRFEEALVTGDPDARADWDEIKRFVSFYAWNVPFQHQPLANVAVVTADPMRSFEVMNLLARHNLPFLSIAPAALASNSLIGIDLLIVLDDPDERGLQRVQAFASSGGTALVAGTAAVKSGPAANGLPWHGSPAVTGERRVSYTVGKGRVIESQEAPVDPNTFALEMRQLLGSERRIVDIWNGITVLVAPFARRSGDGVVLTALNYAAQPLPIQVRVRGTFSAVQYEAPGQPPVLLAFEHRDASTEFVLPALRIGARIFLTRLP
jgi:hypothetical protein